ncbi:MAG: YfcE family phosphodiesterase [Chloroflexi bacterium]|nr:YfcE family phosphodiesterase [Chloroflexota bacterium]
MKVGIIADIHGDSVALRKALALLEAQAVDQIICAGDMVNKGSDAAGVIALLQEHAIATVQGNHDFDACADGYILVYRNERDGIEIPYTHDLSTDMQTYLSSLPLALRFEWENQRLHMTHASTWDQITVLRADADQTLFQRVAAETSADVIIVGHTHVPMIIHVGDQLIVNPGCVYYGYPEFRSTCAILSLPERAFTVFDVDTGVEVEPERLSL